MEFRDDFLALTRSQQFQLDVRAGDAGSMEFTRISNTLWDTL